MSIVTKSLCIKTNALDRNALPSGNLPTLAPTASGKKMARSTSNIADIVRINHLVMQLQTGVEVTLVLTDATCLIGTVQGETCRTSWSSIPPQAGGEVQLLDQHGKQHVIDVLDVAQVIRREPV